MRNRPERMKDLLDVTQWKLRLIWADWAGGWVAFMIAASALMLSIILFIAAGGIFDARLYGSVANWTLAIELAIALPFWLVLRGIDLATGGPAHRRQEETGDTANARREPSLTAEVTEPAPGPDKTGD